MNCNLQEKCNSQGHLWLCLQFSFAYQVIQFPDSYSMSSRNSTGEIQIVVDKKGQL